MKSQVLHTVWSNISGEAVGGIWNWSLVGVKGLTMTLQPLNGSSLLRSAISPARTLLHHPLLSPCPVSHPFFTLLPLLFLSSCLLGPHYTPPPFSTPFSFTPLYPYPRCPSAPPTLFSVSCGLTVVSYVSQNRKIVPYWRIQWPVDGMVLI